MNQIINVELTVNGEEDILVFHIDEEKPLEYYINLNSATNQLEIKKVFSKLLEVLLNDNIELKFMVSEGYSKGLYKDVCKEYVENLQKEIENVKESIETDVQ